MKRVCLCLPAVLLLTSLSADADSTWVYAVQLAATVQVSPPRISLTWPADPYGALSYTVSRKGLSDPAWTTQAALPGSATGYVDSLVAPGNAYEYQVHKVAALGYTGFGYIYAGLQPPPVEDRGRVALVIETNATAPLGIELARLESDLIGDGWSVTRIPVSSNQSPASVRNRIASEFSASQGKLKAAFLLGRIPIFYSGNVNWDTHGGRPMPADGYYGDVDGDWSASPSYFPSTVELMVGRVDFAGMPGIGGANPWPSETELLRNYLDKDHRWRHGQLVVQARSLMGNRRGDEGGGAAAATGYRNFETFTGHGNTIEANVQDVAPSQERWISMVTGGTWLWAYGCGGGFPIGISGLGTHGTYNDVYSTDLRDVGGGAKAAFYMLFASWIAEWQQTDNFMRATLATSDYGLAACLAGRPHWFNHQVGLGEPLGYGARLTMNNTGLYQTYSNAFAGAIYVSLLGDPTLRMHQVRPPANPVAGVNGSTVQLTWTASPDNVAGYYIYRSPAAQLSFARLNSNPVTATAFADNPPAGAWKYMVRALKLQTCPSGSYFNLSQGAFASASTQGGPGPTNSSPVLVRAALTPDGPFLSWNSSPGISYRVQGNTRPATTGWVNLSGPVSSDTTNCSWTDSAGFSLPQGFYRVLREN